MARRARYAFARRNARLLVAFAVFYMLIAALVTWLAYRRSHPAGMFLLGAAVVGLGWCLWAIVTQNDGQQSFFDGAFAEAATAKTLTRLERAGWSLVDDVEFDGFNVDHVLVGPGGVFAIETKWTSRPWGVVDGRLDTGGGEKAEHQAIRSARRIALLLKHHAQVECVVTPTLMIWGAGQTAL